MRGGGSGMLELQNFKKMNDFFAENFGNFWKKAVLRRVSGTFVFEKIASTPRTVWLQGWSFNASVSSVFRIMRASMHATMSPDCDIRTSLCSLCLPPVNKMSQRN